MPTPDQLARAVTESDLPVLLVDLPTLVIEAASDNAVELLGGDREEIAGRDLLEVTDEPDATRDALGVIARGTIDTYEAHRRLRRSDGSVVVHRLRVRSLEREGYPDLVAGTLISAGVIDRRTPDIDALLLRDIHPDDVAPRLEAIEQSLRRIANQVQVLSLASAMASLPAADRIDAPAGLSPRQWEIVNRLLGGERVPSLARSMLLSQSTVRNHLSKVYEKVGVHSQQELIDRLRR